MAWKLRRMSPAATLLAALFFMTIVVLMAFVGESNVSPAVSTKEETKST